MLNDSELSRSNSSTNLICNSGTAYTNSSRHTGRHDKEVSQKHTFLYKAVRPKAKYHYIKLKTRSNAMSHLLQRKKNAFCSSNIYIRVFHNVLRDYKHL
jgi:hypothetical protein